MNCYRILKNFAKKLTYLWEVSRQIASWWKILLCGNGGSAAECQQAGEYMATLNSKNMRKSLPAVALTVDTSFLTAWTNDFDVDRVFSRQISSLAKVNDVLFVYSTSGNSKNIIDAVRVATGMNVYTVGMLGNSGGDLVTLSLMQL